MSEHTDDILQRLESIVTSWSSEVNAAQQRLGEQLAETRDRLRSTTDTTSEALPAGAVERLGVMQRMLEDCTDAVRDVLTRMDALENDVALLKSQTGSLETPSETAPIHEEIPPEPVEAPVEEFPIEEPPVEEAPVEEFPIEEAPADAIPEDEPLEEEIPAEESPAEEPAPPEGTRRVAIQPFDEHGAPRRMGDILVGAGLITQEQLETALEVQREHPQRKLGAILVAEGFTTEEVVPQVLARQLRLPYLRLKDETFDPEAVALVSGRLAARHACIPVRATGETIILAMANPLDLIAIEDVELAAGRRVQPLIARESEIMDAIARWYGTRDGEE